METYEQALKIVKQVENYRLDALNETMGRFEIIKHIPVDSREAEWSKYVKGNYFPTFDKEVDVAYDAVLYNSSKGIDWGFFKLFGILLFTSFLFWAGYQFNNITATPPKPPLPSHQITRPEIEHPVPPVPSISVPSIPIPEKEEVRTR